MSTQRVDENLNQKKEPPKSRVGAPFHRKIPEDFEKKTLDEIRKAKQEQRREFSPAAGALMPANVREINKNFSIRPESNQVCKKHRKPLEFFNPNALSPEYEYICKLCATQQQAEGDKLIGILDAAKDIQKELTKLKGVYLKKKTHVIDRLDAQLTETESYFKIFYNALDAKRESILKEEYQIRDNMQMLEKEMQTLLQWTQRCSMIEMHQGKDDIQSKVASVKQRLDAMGTYLPSIKKRMRPNETEKEMKLRIKELLDATIAENFKEVDNSFSLDNYNHILELGNEKLSKIYTVLGPFDYGNYNPKAEEEAAESSDPKNKGKDKDKKEEEEEDDDSDEDKTYMQDYWDARRSGAMYKGELLNESKRPHGKGIKIFNKTSVYEGFFKDGACHGPGRGITSNGECYQGMFEEDEMTGHGMFYWPDGRIFEGEFYGGRKIGKGHIFWPNGQVYEGEFRNDSCGGNGTLFYPDGKRFVGTWRDGNKHGIGRYEYPDGEITQVVYQEGRRTGEPKQIKGKLKPEQLKEKYKNLDKRAMGQLETVERVTKNKTAKSHTTRLGGPPSEGQENELDVTINKDLSAVGDERQ